MKKVLKIVLCFILIILVVGCNSINKKDSEGFLIGISNKENNDNFQINIIIDKINIREKASVNSKKIGIVEKDSYYNVIDYTYDNKYIWFHIKTENNIEGYIASEITSPYVNLNKEIDVFPPEIYILQEVVEVINRSQIDDAVKKNIRYSDNNDQNLKMDYILEYDNIKTNLLPVKVKITDSSNNTSSINFEIKITGEQLMKDGSWLTYDEMLKQQKKAKSLCVNYGLKPWKDAVGCASDNNTYNILISNSTGTTRIGFNNPLIFCNYNSELEPYFCTDESGNNISHNLISNKLKLLEKTWLPKFKKYLNEVKNVTGYDLEELVWK